LNNNGSAIQVSQNEDEEMVHSSLTEPEFYPLLNKVKVIRTIAESKNMMKKLVLLVDSDNQDLSVDEQIQTLLQRKELFQLTFL
jgi:hypothetical protein